MAFLVHNEYFTPRVMQVLKEAGIDYYTRWDRATGKATARILISGQAAMPAPTRS